MNKMNAQKKMWIILFLSIMIGAFAFAATAENGVPFSIDLKGLSPLADGGWQAAPLNCEFEIYDLDGQSLGSVTAYATSDQLAQGRQMQMMLPQGTNGVRLVPVLTDARGLYAFEEAYTADFSTYDALNYPLIVYLDAGFFTVENVFEDGQAATEATFDIVDGDGKVVQTISTDAQGKYTSPAPIAAGDYELVQAKAAEGALKGKQQIPFKVSAYTGNDSENTYVQYVSSRINEADLSLFEPTVSVIAKAASLYEGEQSVTYSVTGLGLNKNTVDIFDYELVANNLTLLDSWGVDSVAQEGASIQKISYQNAMPQYALMLTMLSKDGQQLGDAVLLSQGGTFVASSTQATGFKALYVHADTMEPALLPGFDGGSIDVTVALDARAADPLQNEVRSIQMDLNAAWRIEDTQLGGQPFTVKMENAVAKSTASVSVVITADETGAALMTLSNIGGRTLPQTDLDVVLPEGWRVKAADNGAKIVRLKDADVLNFNTEKPLSPGETMQVTLVADKATQGGIAKAYIRSEGVFKATGDNPNGNLFDVNELLTNPLKGIAQGSVYAALDVDCTAAKAFDNMQGGKQLSGNVQKDNGEGGLEGLSVVLSYGDSAVNYQALTDADGNFTFYEVEALNEPRVDFALPENMMVVGLEKDDRGFIPNEDMHFALALTCSINGSVTCEGSGVKGVEVVIFNEGDPAQEPAYALTDAQGAYVAAKLTPGTYTVSFQIPDELSARYQLTHQGQSATVELTDDSKEATVSDTAIMLGALRIDVSGPVVSGDVSATLISGNDITVQAANDEQGTISLNGLMPGDYTLQLKTGDAWVFEDAKMHDPMSITIAGGAETALKAGVAKGTTIQGTIESKAEAIQITLEKADGEIVIDHAADTFAFTQLNEGSYVVKASYEGGYLLAQDSLWQAIEGGAQTTIAVTQGETATLPTLKLLLEGSIAGYIWKDSNADAAFTADEPGVKDVDITLEVQSDNGFEPILTTKTDDYGAYGFDNVAPGTYRIHAQLSGESTFVAQENQSRFDIAGYTAPFTVEDGQDVSGISGGVVTPARLKAVVFIDANRNGEQGIYERLLENVLVEVLDADGVAVIAEAMTNELGEAYFNNMSAGNYRVRFTLPENYAFTKKGKEIGAQYSAIDMVEDRAAMTEIITIQEGVQNGVGAGVILLGKLSGRAWSDTDSDGIMSENEPGQPGVTITLEPKKSTGVTYTLVTGEDGYYCFDRVREGSYNMVVSAPEGVMFTRYSATGRDLRSIFTAEGKQSGVKLFAVEAGKTTDNVNIGFVSESSIEGTVFVDANYNGFMDADEAGLAGVQVTLEKAATNDVIAKTQTDANGQFAFSALRGNKYRLKIALPSGNIVFTKTVAATEEGNHVEQRASRREGILDDIGLTDAQTHRPVIGVVYLGSISGSIYYDDNYSGDKQSGEKAVAGLPVILKDEQGVTVDKVQTNRSGEYLFEGVAPGTYTIHMGTAKGSVYVVKGDVIASTDAAYGITKPVVLDMSANVTGIDGGLIKPGMITGMVYADQNDNGVQDADEGGYAGVTVTLVDEQGNPMLDSVQSGEDGVYTLNNVMPGRYQVRYSVGDDEVFIGRDEKTFVSNAFDFSVAQTVTLDTIGALKMGSFSGYFFQDLNANGKKDADEPFLAGAQIALVPTRAELEGKQLTTDETGLFSFTLLRPDEYTLAMRLPDGEVFSKDEGGEYAGYTGRASVQAKMTLSMGAQRDDNHFGALYPATVSGAVWMDENNNGFRDEGERGLANAQVILYDEAVLQTAQTVVTDADGQFVFSGVVPSVFTVSTEMPEKHIAVKGDHVTMRADETLGLKQSGIAVGSGEAYTAISGGLIHLADWGGVVMLDQGGTTIPLAEATITLQSSSGANIGTIVTDEEGSYLFSDLLPDTYVLHAQLPNGYLLVSPLDNSQNRPQTTVKADNTNVGTSDAIKLEMGVSRLNMNVVAVQPGGLGDYAWLDENGNGLQETGERPIQGVEIAIMRAGEVVAQATTNEYGYYAIPNLYPSVYDVKVTYPGGITPTKHRSDIPQIASVLPEGGNGESLVEGVEVQSNVFNLNFDLGFVLTQKGSYPDCVKEIKQRVWTVDK